MLFTTSDPQTVKRLAAMLTYAEEAKRPVRLNVTENSISVKLGDNGVWSSPLPNEN